MCDTNVGGWKSDEARARSHATEQDQHSLQSGQDRCGGGSGESAKDERAIKHHLWAHELWSAKACLSDRRMRRLCSDNLKMQKLRRQCSAGANARHQGSK